MFVDGTPGTCSRYETTELDWIRWGRRDGTMIVVAYRHGLRASELGPDRRGGPNLGKNTRAVKDCYLKNPSKSLT
jgi:hypothetical protein